MGHLLGHLLMMVSLVRRAVGRFVKDKDIERILSEKLDALEVEFEKL